jgi:hypothetical protein
VYVSGRLRGEIQGMAFADCLTIGQESRFLVGKA